MSETFDVLQEGLLSDVYWERCWPDQELPQAAAPTTEDLAVLDELINDDVMVAALAPEARASLRAASLGIERRVRFLTSSGEVLPAPHRLFLALEIAKVMRCFPRDDLRCLASVVVYPGVTRLRRGQEVGVLLMRGPYRLLPHLALIEEVVGLCVDVSVVGGGALKGWRRQLRAHLDECRRWRAQIEPGDALVDERDAFVTFVERGRRLFADTAHLLRRAPALQRALNAHGITIESVVDGMGSVADRVIAALDALDVAAAASIHLPWSIQMQCHTTTGHDPLIHELAHLVDFVYGGIDGVPADDVADGWRQAWAEQEAGGLSFLGSYARTNPAELFAVATEHFFTDAAAVQTASPSLSSLLHDTWGFTPATRKRRSSWWLMRRLLWSKLRGAF